MILNLRSGRKITLAAAAVNALIVFLNAGAAGLLIYGIFILSIVFILPECLRRRVSVERSSAFALFFIGVLIFASLWIAARAHHLSPAGFVQEQAGLMVERVEKSLNSETRANILGTATPSEIQSTLVLEFPSAVAIYALILIWANFLFLLKVNVGSVRERLGVDTSYFANWKISEYWVWPAIASGALLLSDFGRASDVGINVFKFVMAIYAIQGLSILTFFFDHWKLRRIFRVSGYVMMSLFMMPLLLSMGFFDLWFDFRGKFKSALTKK